MTSPVIVERFSSAEEFSRAAEEFLVAREAENNLLLGIAADLARGSGYGEIAPYLGVAMRGGRVTAAIVRTPPYGVAVSESDDDEAVDALAQDVLQVYPDLPGAIGPIRSSGRFVEKWESLTIQRSRIRANERIYRCGAVTRARSPRGEMRAFRGADRQYALQWWKLFISESKLPRLGGDAQILDGIDRRVSDPDGGIFFWEVDGEVVSMAGAGGKTPNGVRIGPVYTPPNERGKGYGTALVADLTTAMLERGRQFCFLFTDLANPISNSIYSQIGYVPVIDCTMYDLVSP